MEQALELASSHLEQGALVELVFARAHCLPCQNVWDVGCSPDEALAAALTLQRGLRLRARIREVRVRRVGCLRMEDGRVTRRTLRDWRAFPLPEDGRYLLLNAWTHEALNARDDGSGRFNAHCLTQRAAFEDPRGATGIVENQQAGDRLHHVVRLEILRPEGLDAARQMAAALAETLKRRWHVPRHMARGPSRA